MNGHDYYDTKARDRTGDETTSDLHHHLQLKSIYCATDSAGARDFASSQNLIISLGGCLGIATLHGSLRLDEKPP
jgi:hypothetical protein